MNNRHKVQSVNTKYLYFNLINNNKKNCFLGATKLYMIYALDFINHVTDMVL